MINLYPLIKKVMLEKVLDMVKNYAEGAVASHPEIPEEKKQETVEATTEAVTDGLKQNFNLSNLSSLTSLFEGGNQVSTGSSNPILSSMQTLLVNALVQRVGLSQGVASSLAANVVPSLMNAFMDKMKEPEGTGLSLNGVMEAFSGGKEKDKDHPDLLGTLGNLFG